MKEKQRVTLKATPESRARHKAALASLESEKDRIAEIAREVARVHERAMAPLMEVFSALRAAREERGMSLSDVEAASGISRSALSRLENEVSGNPTLATLIRVASAVEKEIRISLVDVAPSRAKNAASVRVT